MKIVEKVSVEELREMAEKMFGTLVKANVDIVKKIVIVDMEMYVDGEQELLESGSKQNDLWGINLKSGYCGTDDFIEFDSMINIRPSQNNPSRSVLDPNTQQEIRRIVHGVVYE